MIQGPLVIVLVFVLMLAVYWLAEFVDAVKAAKRDEQAIREWLLRMEQRDTSSLVDDSNTALPDEFKRPNVVPFPGQKTA